MLNAWALAISLALQTPVAPPAAAQTSAPASVQTPAPAPDAIAWPDDQPILRLFQNLALDFRALPSPSTGAVLAIGGGATIAMHPVDDNLSGWARSSGGSSYTRLGNVLGDAWFQVGGAIGAYAGGKIAKNAELTHVGSDLIRAQAINGVITTALKIAADRTRPSGGHRSFPSGHTSASFATAAVLHGHYGWGAGLAGYATAGFISWTRVRDNVHWLSDAIFGGTLGIIAGQTVTHGHRARTWTVVPVKTQGGAAVYFVK